MSAYLATVHMTADGEYELTSIRPGQYGYGWSEWLQIAVAGEWSGGTLTVEAYSELTDRWLAIPGLDALDADTIERFQIAADKYRVVLTGAGSPDLLLEYR